MHRSYSVVHPVRCAADISSNWGYLASLSVSTPSDPPKVSEAPELTATSGGHPANVSGGTLIMGGVGSEGDILPAACLMTSSLPMLKS
jgi:hypothetical protein